MAIECVHFTPVPEHPWTPKTVQWICGDLLNHEAEKVANIAACVNQYLGIIEENCFYHGLTDGKLVAVASFELLPQNATLAEIGYMVVDPNKYRRGYGRHLLTGVEKAALEVGATAMRVYPIRSAEGFFERCGYELPIGAEGGEFYYKTLGPSHLYV